MVGLIIFFHQNNYVFKKATYLPIHAAGIRRGKDIIAMALCSIIGLGRFFWGGGGSGARFLLNEHCSVDPDMNGDM